MTPCSSDFVLDAACSDTLDLAARRALDEHLSECAACSSRRKQLASQREQFLSRRELGARRSRRSPTTRRARRRSLSAVAMVVLGALWMALWWHRVARERSVTSVHSATDPADE